MCSLILYKFVLLLLLLGFEKPYFKKKCQNGGSVPQHV